METTEGKSVMDFQDYHCHDCRKHLPQMTCEHEAQWHRLENKLRTEISEQIVDLTQGLLDEATGLGSDCYLVTSRTLFVCIATVKGKK